MTDRPPPLDGSAASAAPLTVSQLTIRIKQVLAHHLQGTVHVIGELSNYKHHASGHRYFTLKDPNSEVPCVMWRSDASRLKFEPRNGLELVAAGEITVFERAGRYQLYVRRLEPRGTGALELAFRQLSERLQAEGLFATERKRRVPRYPGHIAIVTSPSGAAIRDILQTLARRYPIAPVTVVGVAVQGPGAAEQIAGAIDALNWEAATRAIDVIIVARGGGSIEDLWAFNEERVARAIAASRIPVVSGVGHEIDLTICDLVADLRAPTPTGAAELVTPELSDVRRQLDALAQGIIRAVRQRTEDASKAIVALERREPLRAPQGVVLRTIEAVDHLSLQLTRAAHALIERRHRRVAECQSAVHRIEPGGTVARGHQLAMAIGQRLQEAVDQACRGSTFRLERTTARLLLRTPTVGAAQQRIAGLGQRCERATRVAWLRAGERLAALERHLHAVGHVGTLRRGYSVAIRVRDGKIVRYTGDVAPGERIRTHTLDGPIDSTVIGAAEQLELFK